MCTIEQIDFTGNSGTFYPTETEPWNFFSKIDHLLSNKLTFTKYRRILTIPYIFSDNSSIDQEVKRKQNYTSNMKAKHYTLK